MATITKTWPNPVNRDGLKAAILAAYPECLFNDVNIRIVNVVDDQATNDAIDAILAAHDPNTLTQDQQIQQAATIAVVQGKAYLRKQMLDPTPNITTIYDTLKAEVDGNAYLLQIVSNQITINSNAYTWVLDLVTPTALDRQRYIRCVQDVIALLT